MDESPLETKCRAIVSAFKNYFDFTFKVRIIYVSKRYIRLADGDTVYGQVFFKDTITAKSYRKSIQGVEILLATDRKEEDVLLCLAHELSHVAIAHDEEDSCDCLAKWMLEGGLA